MEPLGCTQIICSDKAGTLTQNKMTVVRKVTGDEKLLMTAMALAMAVVPAVGIEMAIRHRIMRKHQNRQAEE